MTNQLALIQKDLAEQLAPAKAILPSHVSFEKFTNAAAVALATNVDLFDADRQSVSTPFLLVQKTALFQTGAKLRSSFTKPHSQTVSGYAAHSTCR